MITRHVRSRVAVVDVRLPDRAGEDLSRDVAANLAGTKCMVLTKCLDDDRSAELRGRRKRLRNEVRRIERMPAAIGAVATSDAWSEPHVEEDVDGPSRPRSCPPAHLGDGGGGDLPAALIQETTAVTPRSAPTTDQPCQRPTWSLQLGRRQAASAAADPAGRVARRSGLWA
jgi:hypothetical protein